MNYMKRYNKWLSSPHLSEEAKAELRSIKDDKDEIQDRFYKDLEFGTGGMRGKIAMGTNRMNIYTVGKSTQGLANYLLARVENAQRKGVVIAHDPRHKSREFSERVACVLAANGIKAYLFDGIRPTPELSFAVREIGAAAGIVVTASHNPPDYNGYKVYGENGAQILPEVADQIIEQINSLADDAKIKIITEKEAREKNLLKTIGSNIDHIYYEKVKALSLSKLIDKDIKIVYTPLHGTGNIPIRTILEEMEYSNIYVDEVQAQPDPEFSTVKSPNPENSAAFARAAQLGRKVDADILIATDPDCDRVALALKKNTPSLPENKTNESISSPAETEDDYIYLNGNQTGALLLDYILKIRQQIGQLPANGFVIKTIVTSEMGRTIAKHYGIPTYDTLTGFKFICNFAEELEKKGGTFLFGYEESIGYLTGSFVRDKDAVISAMLIAEMAAYYKKQGITLWDALQKLYQRHGYYLEFLKSIFLEGMEGEQQMDKIMAALREEFPEIPDMPIAQKIDYQTSLKYDYINYQKEIIDISKSDVLKCVFADGSWYAIRPSGTEPKIKTYMSFVGKDRQEARQKLNKVKSIVFERINQIIQS